MASVPSEPSWGPAAATASSTTTATVLETAPLQANTSETLHLVLNPRPQNNVQWTEDTVDNEHMNKKKSKKCCIYNKPREFGESSSESEGSEDDGSARPTGYRRRRFCPFGQTPDGNGNGSAGGNPASGSSGSGAR
mmetsp:Transcript_64739/g.124886  ORF Transcript_64739/g.124886 Transcript_64739/m.124886 type:complete len:136 (-) Transcript_64739:122-529(-)